MSALGFILGKIKEVTGSVPVVKGGAQANPIEYKYTKLDTFYFRLEVYVNSTNIAYAQKTSDKINTALADFGDTTKLGVCSIDPNGGGSFTNGNMITQALFYDVTDYTEKPKVPIVPEGTKLITTNGTHDVAQYESVNINVAGGGGFTPYEGSYEVEPSRADQVLPTAMKTLTEDLLVKKIYEGVTSNPKGLTFSIGKE